MSDLRDFTGKNRKFTGVSGIKLPQGSTGDRAGSPRTGELRFNTTLNLAEYYTGTQWKAIDAPPTVTSVDDTEVDSAAGGNQTIVISGSGFSDGAVASFVGAAGSDFNASSSTVNSSTQITAVAPKASFLNAQEPYGVKVTNSSGLSNTLAGQINVDNSPTWTTSAGSLGTVAENSSVSITVAASDADGDTISYAETGGSVLSGKNLAINSSTGVISGTAGSPSSGTSETISFTLRATANSKTADRVFTITINASNYFGDGSDGALDTTP